ncbi:hypothetical protein GCM10009665_37540 [Kitasatospora nipponensis]|uniref:histidine kinase n=1 Tax=Kitasatospora nipponensis TaxID=258049 RepID=A0ABN1WD45_9ACTN
MGQETETSDQPQQDALQALLGGLTAVRDGDLSVRLTVDSKGLSGAAAAMFNRMVEQLASITSEVTRVAREVGSEGRLGGQAEVEGVSGTWKKLTENVNELAGNLTRQVRAIAEVTSAVAEGDLGRSITVDASGEVADLKDNINAMVESLRRTTRANQEQDWLASNLVRLSELLQRQRGTAAVAEVVMSELPPLVGAQYGAFYLVQPDDEGPGLLRIADYGSALEPGSAPVTFRFGQSLVGQVARDRRTILVRALPPNYVTIGSGLGSTDPTELILLPVQTEDQLLAVIELAAVGAFTPLHRDLLDRFTAVLGVNVSSLLANARTDEALQESRRLTAELRTRSSELQSRQKELQDSNAELGDQAEQLAERNRDIEAKNLEIERGRQQLEARAQQLSNTSHYKSEFLANMSHELRTPLNSLLILAQLLAQNPERNLSPKQVEYAEIIHSAGADLLQLINDMLDLSEVEAGKMEITPEKFPLRRLLDNLQGAFGPLAAQKDLEFTVGTDQDVPTDLVTDEARLRQVLRNLVSNAVKFTDQGRVTLTVGWAATASLRTEVTATERMLAFQVEDTGIGIAAEHLESIFGAFQQADGATRRRYGGTGLGLSISRELARLLGGTIAAESRLGVGSRFTLLLPAGADRRRPEPVLASTAVTSSPVARERDLAGRVALVADDDQRTVVALTVVLEAAGLQVLHADNGRACVELLRTREDVDVVLMDLMMPELDGYAATARIRAMPGYGDLPIIVLTAKAMPGDRAESLAAGADDHVTKPVDTAELLSRIRYWLSRSAPGTAPGTATAPLGDGDGDRGEGTEVGDG